MRLCLPACLACQRLPYAPNPTQNALTRFQYSPKRFMLSSYASKRSQNVPNNAEMFPTHPQRTPAPPSRPNAPRTLPNVSKRLMRSRTLSDVRNTLPLTRSQYCMDIRIICTLGIKNNPRPSKKGKSAQHTRVCDCTIPTLCNSDLQVELRRCTLS